MNNDDKKYLAALLYDVTEISAVCTASDGGKRSMNVTAEMRLDDFVGIDYEELLLNHVMFHFGNDDYAERAAFVESILRAARTKSPEARVLSAKAVGGKVLVVRPLS